MAQYAPTGTTALLLKTRPLQADQDAKKSPLCSLLDSLSQLPSSSALCTLLYNSLADCVSLSPSTPQFIFLSASFLPWMCAQQSLQWLRLRQPSCLDPTQHSSGVPHYVPSSTTLLLIVCPSHPQPLNLSFFQPPFCLGCVPNKAFNGPD
jgi:hypothetical protein